MKGEQQQRDGNDKKRTIQFQKLKNIVAQLKKFTGGIQDPP